MAILGRRRGNAPHGAGLPIIDFWRWWAAEGRALLTAALADRRPERMVTPLAARVAEIDPALEWETGAGDRAEHELTLSGAGDPALRRLTERWWRAAPSADAVWQFSPARRAAANFGTGAIELLGSTLSFEHASVTVRAEPQRTRIDVLVHHPALAGLPEKAWGAAVFLMLDALLGEDDVERWLGHVEWRADTAGAEPLSALAVAVGHLVERRPAEATWTLAEGEASGGQRMMVRTQRWRRWLDRPLLDLHTRLSLAYAARPDGYPDADEQQRLEAAEEQLVARVGSSAELVTITTGNGTRTFHLYSDSEDQNCTATLKRVAREMKADVTQSPDPRWRQARFLD